MHARWKWAFRVIGVWSFLILPLRAAPPFTMVVLPDTQYYLANTLGGHPGIFSSQVAWIVSNRVDRDIAFVLHEGDITERNNTSEWAMARATLSQLESNNIPYFVCVGNHDLGSNGTAVARSSLINEYFPPSSYTNKPTWGGAFEPGHLENAYFRISAGGVDWLILSLEFGPRNAVLDWAGQVISNHPDRQVMLLTHSHLHHDNTLLGSKPEHEGVPRGYTLDQHAGYPNDGVEVWNKLLRVQSRVAFVFCGHSFGGSGGARLTQNTDFGVPVRQMLANYQDFANGGNGYLRLLKFYPDEYRVAVKTYSPYLGEYLNNGDNNFEFSNVWCFDRSPPAPPPAPVAVPLNAQTVRLHWPAAADLESGIASYVVWCQGLRAGISPTTNFVHTLTAETNQYAYEVQAVNGAGLMSERSTVTVVPAFQDHVPPKLVAAGAFCGRITLTFSKPVSGDSVSNLANFVIAADLPLQHPRLEPDLRTVTLDAPALAGGTLFTLTVSGVSDRMPIPNVAGAPVGRKLVNQPCYMFEEFDRGTLSGWSIVDDGNFEGPSRWALTNDAVVQRSNIFGPHPGAVSNRMGTYLLWNAPEALAWSNYILEATVRTEDDDGIGFLFHYQNRSNYCKLDLDRQQAFRRVFRLRDGVETTVAQAPGLPYTPNTDLVFRLEVSADVASLRLNGQDLFGAPVALPDLRRGAFALYVVGSAGVWFDHIRVVPPTDYPEESDQDEDGIPDAWEQDLLGAAFPFAASGLEDVSFQTDHDGDGCPDGFEWMAGTEPLNGGSRFTQLAPQLDGSNGVQISWTSVAGKRYRVCRSNNMRNGFLVLRSNMLSSAPITTASDSLGEHSSVFYQVELEVPGAP